VYLILTEIFPCGFVIYTIYLFNYPPKYIPHHILLLSLEDNRCSSISGQCIRVMSAVCPFGLRSGPAVATHSVFLRGQFVRCLVSLALPLRLLGSYTGGRVLAAAAILVRALLLHCRGPSRWSQTDPAVRQKLVSHHDRTADKTRRLCC